MKRIISRLDIKGPNLVKGINLEGLRVLGDPDYFAQKYYENLSDEIIYQDCVASLYERKYLLDIIQKTSSHVYIPISVGGGIKSIKDIEKVLSAGADKVFINSAAIKKPRFLQEASKKFGSANICLSIETAKNEDGQFYCLSNYGRETSKRWRCRHPQPHLDRQAESRRSAFHPMFLYRGLSVWLRPFRGMLPFRQSTSRPRWRLEPVRRTRP